MEECDEFDEQQARKGITCEAFKTFQKILICKLKMEICWIILRHFGYDNELKIVSNLWDDKSIADEELEMAHAFELKNDALTFLSTIFKTHTSSRAQKMDLASAERVFATTEQGTCPWDIVSETVYENRRAGGNLDQVEQTDRNYEASSGISLENWIGLWNKYFHRDTKMAFRDLVYIGFCGKLEDAIYPIKARPRDIFGVPSTRKTFNCLVVGASSSGKSAFLDAFVGASQNQGEERKEANPAAANMSPDHILRSSGRLVEARSVVKALKEKDPKNKD